MAYIHCHTCSWSQDDFYSPDGYNPIKSLSNWNDALFGPKLDKQFSTDIMFIRKHGAITTREVIALEYERYARNIRNMKWITWEDYKEDPNKKCPRCGSGLCID